MKNISVTLAMAVSLLSLSCQDQAGSGTDNTDASSTTDTVQTGLEGTRDQAATVAGSTVVQDTTAGQSPGKEQAGVQKADSGKVDSSNPK